MNWTIAKERTEASGYKVRLYVGSFGPDGKPRHLRRITQKSRAGFKPGRFGQVWMIQEFCERNPDGTLTPWRTSFAWPKQAAPSAPPEQEQDF